MAIDRIGSQQVGTLLLQGPTAAGTRRGQSGERSERTERSTDAMRVELSPAARRGAAERAVTQANTEAAASTSWFASQAGAQALGSLARR